MKNWMVLILGITCAFFVTQAWAEGAEAATDILRSDLAAQVKMCLALAAGLGMGLATFGGALGQSKAISSAVEGIARNPEAQPKIFIPMVLGLALIESLVLLTFVVAMGLSGKI